MKRPYMTLPVEAFDVCETEAEELAVLLLWRHADKRMNRPFAASSRFLQRMWSLSARKTEGLLRRLVETGLVQISQEGTSSSPRYIECWDPRHADAL
ncbi:MAG: hypothetical protein HRU14_17355 [Planctomycetes bacterium]|nr:hypothetical protein [Planctomycetota bacterium]